MQGSVRQPNVPVSSFVSTGYGVAGGQARGSLQHGGMQQVQAPRPSQFRLAMPSPFLSASMQSCVTSSDVEQRPSAPRASSGIAGAVVAQMEMSSTPVPPMSISNAPSSPPTFPTASRSEEEPSTITDGPACEADAGKTPNKPSKKASRPWFPNEQVALARLFGEDDALCASASGPHKCMERQDQLEWISKKMREEGYKRSSEDGRKKLTSLMKKVKEINDKCGRSGGESYWEMTKEKRREASVYPAFDKVLWDAMAWVMTKPSMTYDNTLSSDNMHLPNDDLASGRTGGGEGSSSGGAKRGRTARDALEGSNSDMRAKRSVSGR
ncbi:hypothetical protein CBR_g4763 [Chara braunii]|uniref:Myb/SANT-like DNA-binding domain-containing protein n=1 Tax=Chara braunii TaxID=69332 RepID=A0A388KIT2_CHABU|nr:hypothetical protein CBR_g4763 [Chara braunii]|eukprot:GBG69937.1 hypothetical protein CBR_g4763 [Chara braunii]